MTGGIRKRIEGRAANTDAGRGDRCKHCGIGNRTADAAIVCGENYARRGHSFTAHNADSNGVGEEELSSRFDGLGPGGKSGQRILSTRAGCGRLRARGDISTCDRSARAIDDLTGDIACIARCVSWKGAAVREGAHAQHTDQSVKTREHKGTSFQKRTHPYG